MGKTTPKVPFFKDSGCCPKILDYALRSVNVVTLKYLNVKSFVALCWLSFKCWSFMAMNLYWRTFFFVIS